VGWYPSGQPAAGPFAQPAAPPRRGVPGLSRLAKPAGAGWTRAWSGRSTLMNVLLFGVGPVAMAGVIVAAFLLVSPGKGSASSRGFEAGPAPSTQQLTASPMATPSQSPSASPSARKKHPRATSSASPGGRVPSKTGKAAKAKATPKPAHKAGKVTPHNLGAPNFAGYCQHIGHRTAELLASNAYGWRCTLNAGVLKTVSVCAWTYHLATSQVIDVSTNFNDPNAWQCWRINHELGPLDVTKYCTASGHGTSKLVASNAYGWQCTSPAAALPGSGTVLPASSPASSRSGSSSAAAPPCASGASGRAIRNVAPWFGAVRTEATPPCAVTSAFTMASPSPLPPVARVLAWSVR